MTVRQKRILSLLLLLAATVVWGSTFVILKDAVRSVDPFLLVFVRNALAAGAMTLWLLVADRRALADRKAWRRGLPLGSLLAVTYAAQTFGLQFTSVGHSAFITGAAVVVVPLILLVVLRERLAAHEGVCAAAVFAGLYMLAYDGQTRINPGDAITFVCTLAYAVHIVLAGRFVMCTAERPLINAQFVWAAAASLLFYAMLGGAPPGTLGARAWGALLYLGLIATLFCYFVAVWAQKTLSAMQVMLVFALEPVFAAAFGYLVLRERLTSRELFGAGLMLTGVVAYQAFQRLSVRSGTESPVSMKN